MQYQYKMVQIPPNIEVKGKSQGKAAQYLEGIVSEYAKNGWEFWRVDSIGVREKAGCLGLFASQQPIILHYVITFRKEVG